MADSSLVNAVCKLEDEGSTLRILEHFWVLWIAAQTAAMPSSECYSSQIWTAKPKTSALGRSPCVGVMRAYHRDLVFSKYARGEKMKS